MKEILDQQVMIHEQKKREEERINPEELSYGLFGRMLNKRCQTLGIPLLNIVRKQEQADLLKSQGAKHVIITQGDWQ